MVREGQAHADEDKARRDRAEATNEGDTVAYQAEKFLRENGDKIPAEKKTELESKIADVRSALGAADVAAIRAAAEQLKTTLSSVGAGMYQQGAPEGDGAAGAPPPPPPGDSKGPDGDVVDGEYRETK